MTPQQQKEAFKFMFAEFGKPIWWKPGSLTKVGNPKANPPDLNIAEAESIFRLLASKELIFPFINEHGESCFLIHHAKEKEWKELINPPNFCQRHWKKILLWIGAFILWSLSLVYSTYITKTVENRVEKINQKIMKWETVEKEQGQNTKNTETNKMSR
jgi:hypothetical protein